MESLDELIKREEKRIETVKQRNLHGCERDCLKIAFSLGRIKNWKKFNSDFVRISTKSELIKTKYKFLCILKKSEIPKIKSFKKIRKPFVRGHRNKIFTPEQTQEILMLKKQGFSNVRIGKIFQCSEKTIRNYLKE